MSLRRAGRDAASPTIVVVGAASRDLTDDDPRGWRLGGGVAYSALTTARLGVPTGAVIGVDDVAAELGHEIATLREAGVDVELVLLQHAPVFRNIERPEGRLQEVADHAAPMPVDSLPARFAQAPGWILAPVARELPEVWADMPREDATVVVGWQGLLRDVVAGGTVRQRAPTADRMLARADLVGVSRDDVAGSVTLADLCRLLRSGATLVVSQGDRGGLVLEAGPDGPTRVRHYPAMRSSRPTDPTGAGDTFLAALAAARIEPRLLGGRLDRGWDLRLAAAAASLVVEAPGLDGVPDRARLQARLRGEEPTGPLPVRYGDTDLDPSTAGRSSR